jgi:DNA-binding Lrp family transcriptional regulator
MNSTRTDLDGFDRKLLDALQRDCSRTNAELGDAVGLSASQISRRRERLEQEGLIRAWRADIEPARLGLDVIAFVRVTLASHSGDTARRFRDLVRITPEVLEAHAVTGGTDYLLKIAVNDLKAMSKLVSEVLLPHKSVARVQSEIVPESLKDERVLPIL